MRGLVRVSCFFALVCLPSPHAIQAVDSEVAQAQLSPAIANDTAVSDLRTAQRELNRHSADVDRVTLRSLQLAIRWDIIAATFEHTAGIHAGVENLHSIAILGWQSARNRWEGAAEQSNSAAQLWRLYQVLVVIATGIDAHSLGRARARDNLLRERFDCSESISNATYRRRLEAQGFNWHGKDAGHIVPRSLGGSDHPANRMPMDSSLNRSLGNLWSMPLCESQWGSAICRRAVAASRQCGTF